MKRFLKNKKGFTLIELIVVMAILGILAAIALPRFSGMRSDAAINADAATAAQIANVCRIQEVQTGSVVGSLSALTDLNLKNAKPVSNKNATDEATGLFRINGGGDSTYKVIWKAATTNNNAWQLFEEGKEFTKDNPAAVAPSP